TVTPTLKRPKVRNPYKSTLLKIVYSARPRALLQRPRAENIRSQRAGGKGKKNKKRLSRARGEFRES
ncbi:hypothetical protein ACOIXN_001438, partial [Vibrio vulnificus]